MSNKTDTYLGCSLGVAWALFGATLLVRQCGTYDILDSTPGQAAQSGDDAGDIDGGSRKSAQEVGSSGSSPALATIPLVSPEANAARGDPASGSVVLPVETKPLVTLLSGFDYSATSPEDLADFTIGLWSDEGFLGLTQEEARELLALDDAFGMKGPDSMLAILGPPPTEDDCRMAYTSLEVRETLQEVLLYESMLVEYGFIPMTRRTSDAEPLRQELVRIRDMAMEELMLRCERNSSFKLWRAWWALYKRWSDG